MGDHGLNHKGCRFYEGLSHVPLIFSWPARFRRGLRSPALVELTDIWPTIMEALGIPAPAYVQGRSLYRIATGQAGAGKHREFVRAEFHDVLDMPDHTHANMLRDERYKLVSLPRPSVGRIVRPGEGPRASSRTCGATPVTRI